jgi:hypothetical protein
MHKQLPAVIALAFALAAPPILAKQYHVERFDIDIHISSAGTLEIEETTAFSFRGGPFTYVYRDVAADKTDGLEFIEALLDGRSIAAQVRGPSPLRVRWDFPTTSDAVRTTTLRYRVRGAIRHTSDGDELAWTLFPRKAKYRIGGSRIEVNYPTTVGAPEIAVRGARAEIQRSDGSAVVTLRDVKASRNVVLRARFPSGSLISAPPRWEQTRSDNRRRILTGLLYGGVCGIVLVVLVLLWMPKTPAPYSTGTTASTEPPPNMPPALFAVLANRINAAQGLLVDLARRGAVRIDEQPGRWGRKFRITHLASPVALAPYERNFLETGFRHGETELSLSEFASRVQFGWRAISRAIRAELHSQGLIDPDRERTKHGIKTTAIVSLLGGLALGVAAAVLKQSPEIRGFLLMLGGSSLLLAIIAGMMVASADVWSYPGAERAAQAKSFARHLSDVTRGRAAYTPSVFETWLPYAAAIGLGSAFTKRVKRYADTVLPDWFASMHGADGADAAFVAFMASSDAGAGGGDGGGASGGGDGGAG